MADQAIDASKSPFPKWGPAGSAAKIAGFAITALACVFVAEKILSTGVFQQPVWRNAQVWAGIIALAAAYAGSQMLLVTGWMALLNAGQRHVSFRRGAAIYYRTIVLKYLPSNVLHIAGRYGLTRHAGATHVALLRATLGELALLLLAGVVVAALFVFPLFVKTLAEINAAAGAWLILAGIMAGVAVLLIFSWVIRQTDLVAFLTASMTAFLSYLAFFVAAGAIFASLQNLLGQPLPAGGFLTVLGINALAWVAGFIVPGAPAGLGVRESVLIAGLGASGAMEAAVLVAVGYRIVTLLGDVMATTFGALAPLAKPPNAP